MITIIHTLTYSHKLMPTLPLQPIIHHPHLGDGQTWHTLYRIPPGHVVPSINPVPSTWPRPCPPFAPSHIPMPSIPARPISAVPMPFNIPQTEVQSTSVDKTPDDHECACAGTIPQWHAELEPLKVLLDEVREVRLGTGFKLICCLICARGYFDSLSMPRLQ
jgi:hypothetical protein